MEKVHETEGFYLETRSESLKVSKDNHLFVYKEEITDLHQFQKKMEKMASNAFLSQDDENAKKYRSMAHHASEFQPERSKGSPIVEISYELIREILEYAKTDPKLSQRLGLDDENAGNPNTINQ